MNKVSLFSRAVPAILLIVALLIVDQLTKVAVDHYLPLQEPVHLLPVLALYRTYNTGVAFSMFDETPGYLIVGLRLAIVAFVSWLWVRTPASRWIAHLGFVLVIAGAFGNLLDRFLYGHVIDFVLFHLGTWSFAVFNLADSFITVGAVLIGFDEIFGSGEKSK
jgi:signal peptidase II